MTESYAWGADLVPTIEAGLESFDMSSLMGACPIPPQFKPVSIVVENGLYFANIYLCQTMDSSPMGQQVVLWLSSLKETDYVHLTLSSLFVDVPLRCSLAVIAALSATKATIDLHLDTMVMDQMAYLYLMIDKITVDACGALFVPSYVDQRSQDMSGPFRAVHDMFAWIVEEAVKMGRLTSEEAQRLQDGSHVIVPVERFQ